VIKGLEEFYKNGIIWEQGQTREVKTLSTGKPALDEALGGGFPVGDVVEVSGPEGVGKTTIALCTAAEAQKTGEVAYIDMEHCLNLEWAKKQGVDISKLIIAQPDCAEQALEIVDGLIAHKKTNLIIVDSVAALVPRAELEGQPGDACVGLQPRLMNQALRRIKANLYNKEVTIIFINQLRMKIVMFGNPETTPGGQGLKFFSAVRLDLRRKELIKRTRDKKLTVVGIKVKAKAVKNKNAAPFRECLIDILF